MITLLLPPPPIVLSSLVPSSLHSKQLFGFLSIRMSSSASSATKELVAWEALLKGNHPSVANSECSKKLSQLWKTQGDEALFELVRRTRIASTAANVQLATPAAAASASSLPVLTTHPHSPHPHTTQARRIITQQKN